MSNHRVRWMSSLAVCAVVGTAVVAQGPTVNRAQMDKPVKEFTLQDAMADKETSLSTGQYKGKKATILFFVSSTCPVTWRYEKRVGQMMQKYGKEVAFIGVKSHAGESAETIRRFCEARNFDMPVLLDSRNAVSRYFDVHQTPTFVLIDKNGVLRYKGAFDDSPDETGVSAKYVPAATDAVLKGRPVSKKQTVVPG